MIRRLAGGEIRWCRRCEAWWPATKTFWHTIPAGTPAHTSQRSYVRRTDVVSCVVHGSQPKVSEKRQQAAQAFIVRESTRCLVPDCIVNVPKGRGICHGCDGRKAGPLTVDRLESLGLLAQRDAAA